MIWLFDKNITDQLMHTLHVYEIKMYEMGQKFTTTLPRQEGDLATIRQWKYTKMSPEQYGQYWANCILRSIILTHWPLGNVNEILYM